MKTSLRRTALLLALLPNLAGCAGQETALIKEISAAQPVDNATSQAPVRLHCQGNEPFWSLYIDGNTAAYRILVGATEPQEQVFNGEYRWLNHLKPRLLVWRGAPTASGSDLVAFISEQKCIDTMADPEESKPFTHTAWVSTPDHQALVGCCRLSAVE